MLYGKPIANAVVFRRNGGQGTMTNQVFIHDVAQYLKPNTFQKADSQFLGWSESATGTVAYDDQEELINLTEVHDALVNLYAVWEASVSITPMKEESLSIFPNPVQDYLFISCDYVDISRFVILNTLGKIEMMQDCTYGTLDNIPVANLKSGLYILQIYGSDGVMRSLKFVKK